ncbi:aminopeptidase P family protein [Mesomycoplasma hyorhinis]|uniref:Aminopeptidase P family protein n=3 Tax=Mesomycoplasma hyorhinis TaxID=2100 RepID=A0AAJ5TBP3_MESHY|nr:aminopeptidase P family protein [Mesomycoplasma hyorhinis]ADM21620.1 Xaa-pro aminopeptidase [Mesomycoplasma hyorhinis HUB-1]AEC45821.1 Xaa-pro aminopeptidase [Mesomycoplasma hyorhinis MCLD]AEX13952.1 metallopeptidase M24 family protein [Mesomycoplasma hyorhinis GDL-1]AFX74101.1 Aminopeptidase YpdF (MP-, MA-, MS-, AP-, NP- specific) [Mesomycoplasma hyorhinis SK76]AHA40919.1 metallopeptidase M24 family protein [Mesomycoplasma hyorhinis DBS 1050]
MNRKYLDLSFEEHNLDAIISFSQQTRLWVSNLQTSDGIVFLEKEEIHLFVDSRYIEAAQKDAKNVQVHLLTAANLKDFVSSKNYLKIGVEKEYLTLADFKKLQAWFPSAEFVQINAQKLRLIKTKEEIYKIEKAVKISLRAYEELLKHINKNDTEKTLDIKLNFFLKKYGADKESFDSIIATGANAAMPHYHPKNVIIKENDFLKIDFGASYQGYIADITRTIIFKKEENFDPRKEEILQIVLEAAKLGRQAVRPGITAAEVDKVCRDYIASKGYGEYFVHSTGHGVGIDVHELPSVSVAGSTVLEPGMLITVEPGIYIPGFGGARNEDVVLVTNTGSLTLSRPKEINGVEQE